MAANRCSVPTSRSQCQTPRSDVVEEAFLCFSISGVQVVGLPAFQRHVTNRGCQSHYGRSEPTLAMWVPGCADVASTKPSVSSALSIAAHEEGSRRGYPPYHVGCPHPWVTAALWLSRTDTSTAVIPGKPAPCGLLARRMSRGRSTRRSRFPRSLLTECGAVRAVTVTDLAITDTLFQYHREKQSIRFGCVTSPSCRSSQNESGSKGADMLAFLLRGWAVMLSHARMYRERGWRPAEVRIRRHFAVKTGRRAEVAYEAYKQQESASNPHQHLHPLIHSTAQPLSHRTIFIMLSTTLITAFTLFATMAQVQGATIPAASSTATPCTSVVFVTKTAMPTSVLTVTKHTTSTAVPKGKLVSSPQGTYVPRRRADVTPTPTTTVTVVKTSTATDATTKTVTSTSTTTSTVKTTLTATATAKVTSTQTQTSTVTSPVTKVVTATASATRTATVTAFTTDAETSTATVTTTVGEKTVTEGDVARRALPTAA